MTYFQRRGSFPISHFENNVSHGKGQGIPRLSMPCQPGYIIGNLHHRID